MSLHHSLECNIDPDLFSDVQARMNRPLEPLAPRNDLLDSGDWIRDVIWDASRLSPGLIQDDDDVDIKRTAATTVGPAIGGPLSKLDPFNISNDHLYERTRAQYRIRQTFGAIEVFHSAPAKNLQIPFVSCRPAELPEFATDTTM